MSMVRQELKKLNHQSVESGILTLCSCAAARNPRLQLSYCVFQLFAVAVLQHAQIRIYCRLFRVLDDPLHHTTLGGRAEHQPLSYMRPSMPPPLDIGRVNPEANILKLYRIWDIEVLQTHVPIPVMFLQMSSRTPTQDVSGVALAKNHLKTATGKPCLRQAGVAVPYRAISNVVYQFTRGIKNKRPLLRFIRRRGQGIEGTRGHEISRLPSSQDFRNCERRPGSRRPT